MEINMSSIHNEPKAPQDEEDEEFLSTILLLCGSFLPMTLKAAIELNLFEIMAKAGPDVQLSPTEIASQLPTKNPQAPFMLDRILRLLASYSVLTWSVVTGDDGHVQRRYGLAPICKFLIRNEDGGDSLAAFALMANDKVHQESWHYLKDAVLDGESPFAKAFGMTVFEYSKTNPRFNNLFNKAMSCHSTLVMKKFLERYKGFETIRKLVDVGGGVGSTLNMILSKYPHIKGLNFDIPHVISKAPAFLGMEHVAGDMFLSVPSGDAILMKWILHNWSDDHCLKLLSNCWKALPDSGKVIIIEIILPAAPEATNAVRENFLADMAMFTMIPGGKERNLKEFKSLALKSGFSKFNVVCNAFNVWVMELSK